jgi:ATP-dependent DNA ligase|tara:strand:- start:541 stop:1530 length:990 start_codon:yes stop_codon:yes gene_type:complete
MERLIKQDKHNRDRYIDIKVVDLKNGTADIVKISGIVGSDKFTESRTNVKTGYEKALKRAQTVWNNEHAKCNQVLPMLANKWEDRKKYISEPFYVQPKLDGVRLLVSKDGGISRTGKIVPGTEILGKGLKKGQYVDGEAFDPKLSFEELTSTFKMDPLKLKFYVFDYFDLNKLDMTFEKRWNHLRKLKNPHYKCVETTLLQEHHQMSGMHEEHVKDGHEGTMIRDRDSVYEVGQRSNYLLKHKDFQTEEYEITGAKTGHGRDANAVVWVCKTQDGHQFTVRPEGTIVQREEYYKNYKKYLGKMLTVRFQNLTAINVPRFPVGVVIRDYE